MQVDLQVTSKVQIIIRIKGNGGHIWEISSTTIKVNHPIGLRTKGLASIKEQQS